LQYSYRAGYDPMALIDILERLEQGGTRVPGAFSTHPMTRDRTERAWKEIAEVLPARDDYVVSTSKFEEIRSYLRRLQQAEGKLEPGAGPGPRLRRSTGETHSEGQ